MNYSDTTIQLSPWSSPVDPEIIFPKKDFEKLLFDLGWIEPSIWLNHWLNQGGINLGASAWPPKAKSDWIWGLGLPFLSDLERYLNKQSNPVLFGISGLPGCGKTSFGHWIEAAAVELNWSVIVISMDDFYLPAIELDEAMLGNPWNVPRALPGSHSIELLEQTLDSWLLTGELLSPKFDKSLRNGLGDRCGWRHSKPKVLIIEGWFLGCKTFENHFEAFESKDESYKLLTENEYKYRKVINEALKSYQPLWKRFERIWHLKASNFNSTSFWKTEQEHNMQKRRGASLQGRLLESFIRMIQFSIPQETLESIESDVVAIVNRSRQITWVGSNYYNQTDY